MQHPTNIAFIVTGEHKTINYMQLGKKYAYFLAACDLIPNTVKYIILLSETSFNPKRAEMLKALGCIILYDENNKGKCGDMLHTCVSNSASDEEQPILSVNDWKLTFNGTHPMLDKYIIKKAYDTTEIQVREIIRPLSTPSYARPNENISYLKLADILACGQHDFAWATDSELEDWRMYLFEHSNIEIDEQANMASELVELANYVRIWKNVLHKSGITLDLGSVPLQQMTPYLVELSKVFGIADMIKAYAVDGVPVDDLCV
jgi:hypothetical protein